MKNVPNHDNLVDLLSLQRREGQSQMSDVFVNVSDQTELHLEKPHRADSSCVSRDA